ncbi:hypothetical protein FRC07_001571 [Ceratobasidium sp. 392]|nr:hypothetical protein FRC07_001571 [Ceratobasidium sp. 392]
MMAEGDEVQPPAKPIPRCAQFTADANGCTTNATASAIQALAAGKERLQHMLAGILSIEQCGQPSVQADVPRIPPGFTGTIKTSLASQIGMGAPVNLMVTQQVNGLYKQVRVVDDPLPLRRDSPPYMEIRHSGLCPSIRPFPVINRPFKGYGARAEEGRQCPPPTPYPSQAQAQGQNWMNPPVQANQIPARPQGRPVLDPFALRAVRSAKDPESDWDILDHNAEMVLF